MSSALPAAAPIVTDEQQQKQRQEAAIAAQQAQKQQQLAHQKEEEEKKRKAEELRRALEEAPSLDVPWQLLESSASRARIRALARSLDPSMDLDEGAVQVRRWWYA